MTRRMLAFLFTFVVGAIVGHLAIPSVGAQAQTHKSMTMTRLYTGPDNQTHAEEVEMKFTSAGSNEVFKMLPVNAAELHRGAAGRVSDWHRGPRRQYVITLSGTGELEVAGGKKIPVGPGHIELIEDTTGKGHITKVTGTEERVTLQLPIAP
jgi:quercetin dioxygenase-like cupin family protein